ncbi:MAG: 2-dehydro-3-deoxyphosphogluconate aldolase, partial [Melioribacteraceae bacterium]|nr:2-dehydro-3-deoxyphosphogluconate aldolase [Melioribacteraceae bacterium]
MKREEIVEKIIESKVVAIIRMDKSDKVISVAEAMIEGGIVSLEITMTTPNALQIIKELSDNYGSNVLIGVGSIVDGETTIKAIEAGAKYIISPIFKKEILEASHKLDIPAIPGCYTPTEIYTAQEAGADIV